MAEPYTIVNNKYVCHDGTLMDVCPACEEDGIDDGYGHTCSECNKRVCPACWAWRMHVCYACAKAKGLYAPFKCATCEEEDPREKREYDCVVCRRELCVDCYSEHASGWAACDDCIQCLIDQNH